MSCRSKANKGCVRQQKGATGVGFDQVFHAWKKHSARIATLECVTQLAQSDGEDQSDKDYIVERFNEEGAFCVCEQMDAFTFGGPVRRSRLWWGVLRGVDESDYDEATVFFKSILSAFRVADPSDPPDSASMRGLVATADSELITMAQAIGMPLLRELGAREPRNIVDGAKLEYKVDHK
eukprot:7734432-Pyramimonas_sp.AAC.1